MKLYQFNYTKGVEGLMTSHSKKYMANSEAEAKGKFTRDFEKQMKSKELDKVTILETSETDVPALNDKEISRLSNMFSDCENPVLEYQLMKHGASL